MSKCPTLNFPEGKDFAFTIFDDTDISNINKIKPVYDFLYDLGILTTKSVWVLSSNNPGPWANRGQTLKDKDYLHFVLQLQKRGFEIALHGARGGSSKRQKIQDAINRFREIIGHYPFTYANHSINKDNLYWGDDRIDFLPLKLLSKTIIRNKSNSEGHKINSDYFWGDIAVERIPYVRNFIFKDINTLKMNHSMPYHDPRKPYVNYWFSASNGRDVNRFNELLCKKI